MLGLNELIAANQRAEREARASARRPPNNLSEQFRIVGVPNSGALQVFRREPPLLRLRVTAPDGTLVDTPLGESERELAAAILRDPVLRITRAHHGEGRGLRGVRFDIDRDAGGFARWTGTVGYEVARGFAAQVGVSRDVFDACFSTSLVVLS